VQREEIEMHKQVVMQLKLFWNERFAGPYAHCISADASMPDWSPLTCLLMDDGGLSPDTALRWCQEGIARVEAVLFFGADSPVCSDRETWEATLTKHFTRVCSLHDEQCAEVMSTEAFHQALVAWTKFIRAGEHLNTTAIDLEN
jgi:hypothetical protein